MRRAFDQENNDGKTSIGKNRTAGIGARPRLHGNVGHVWPSGQGARRRDRLSESLGALSVDLSDSDMAAIERAIPKDAAAGGRYPEAQLTHLDSER